MRHGWEKYRKEGIEELKRLAGSRFFVSKPAQITLLNIYTDVYQKEQERNLKGTNFYPDEPIDIAHKKASKNIKELRYSLPEFYKSEEGGVSSFELYFIAEERDYRLGIRPKVEPGSMYDEIRKQFPPEGISYIEKHFFETKYKPVLLIIIPAIIAGTVFISFITGGVFVDSPILFAFLLVIAVVILFISRNLYRLPHWRFTHFFHKFFLRLSEQKIILATYSSTCPECGGEVELTSKMVKGTGYVARCRNNQHCHIFSFDHTTLEGERIYI